jgi:hypothetical protein
MKDRVVLKEGCLKSHLELCQHHKYDLITMSPALGNLTVSWKYGQALEIGQALKFYL